MTIAADRLENLVLARMRTSPRPLPAPEIAKALYRFAPPSLGEPAWRERVEHVVAELANRGIGPDDLDRRLGKHSARTWAHYVDRVFPALALGIEPGDTKAQSKLAGRDAWTAAIAARALGVWTDGPPPSLPSVCDAYAWKQLGLTGRAKRCPPEVRAVFLQRELGTDQGPPDRLLRLYAARSLDAPRPELRALRDSLVRRWLAATSVSSADMRSADASPADASSADASPADASSAGANAATASMPSFADAVHAVVRGTNEGVFGERKVFIAAAWRALCRRPDYASLTLDDFKSQLVRAHRAGALVLARADLVAAMDPELVAASEIDADGTTFHFVVREAR